MEGSGKLRMHAQTPTAEGVAGGTLPALAQEKKGIHDGVKALLPYGKGNVVSVLRSAAT